jgi:hypothetical protein
LVNEVKSTIKQFQFMAYPTARTEFTRRRHPPPFEDTLFTKFLKDNCPPGEVKQLYVRAEALESPQETVFKLAVRVVFLAQVLVTTDDAAQSTTPVRNSGGVVLYDNYHR